MARMPMDARRSLRIVGHQYRNGPPIMTAIDSKMTVKRHQPAMRCVLGHSHHAGVGQRHREIAVSPDERANPGEFLEEFKAHLDQSSIHQFQQVIRIAATPPDKKARLRQHRLAGKKRRLQPFERRSRPSRMPFIRLHIGNQRAGIGKNLDHLPSPSRCFGLLARSRGPRNRPALSLASE